MACPVQNLLLVVAPFEVQGFAPRLFFPPWSHRAFSPPKPRASPSPPSARGVRPFFGARPWRSMTRRPGGGRPPSPEGSMCAEGRTNPPQSRWPISRRSSWIATPRQKKQKKTGGGGGKALFGVFGIHQAKEGMCLRWWLGPFFGPSSKPISTKKRGTLVPSLKQSHTVSKSTGVLGLLFQSLWRMFR